MGGGGGLAGNLHWTLPGAVKAIPAHRNLFGVGGEGGKPLMTSAVAMHLMRSEASVELIVGYKPRSCAIAPATCGHAIDVPDNAAVAVLLSVDAALILLPGARRSTQGPKLEKLEKLSDIVVEPTVIASAAAAGEEEHASCRLLPAATTTLIPLS